MRSERSPEPTMLLRSAGARAVDPLALHVVELGLQQLHRLGLVLVLGLFGLLRHRDAGGQMGDAHRAFGLVDMLAARALGAIDVDAQILVVDHDVDVLGFGQHRHRGRRGVDAALGFGHRHALHAMHAAFEFQLGIGAAAVHFQDRVLDAAQIAFGQSTSLRSSSPAGWQ